MNTFLKFGIDDANKLNKKAIRTLAHFEVKRVKELSEYSDKEISSYEDTKAFINDAFSVLKKNISSLEGVIMALLKS